MSEDERELNNKLLSNRLVIFIRFSGTGVCSPAHICPGTKTSGTLFDYLRICGRWQRNESSAHTL